MSSLRASAAPDSSLALYLSIVPTDRSSESAQAPVGATVASSSKGGNSAPKDKLPAGTLIGGRYRIDDTLGSGGMACVHLATDMATGRELALKRLFRTRGKARRTPAPCSSASFTCSCSSPIRAWSRSTTSVSTSSGRSTPWNCSMVATSKRRARARGASLRAALRRVLALALVHSRRLVHGDVSPRNVRCTREGHAKLIDFGALTPMGRCDKIVGTPAFVSPEVVGRLTLDARTDLFSFGATLLLRARRPAAVPRLRLRRARAGLA